MRRTIAFVVLLTATVLLAGCTTADNSNMAGKANIAATPANTNTGAANTNNANANMSANMNMANKNMSNMNMSNMNMSNMNTGKPNKKANTNKTP